MLSKNPWHYRVYALSLYNNISVQIIYYSLTYMYSVHDGYSCGIREYVERKGLVLLNAINNYTILASRADLGGGC